MGHSTLLEAERAAEAVARRLGLSRREFLQFCAATAGTLGLPAGAEAAIAKAVESAKRPSVIWLHFQECTGCSESLLRAEHPTLEKLILDVISLDYHETLMAAAGHQAEKARKDAMAAHKGKYVLVVEGAIPTKENGIYCIVGGETAIDMVKECAADAAAVIAIGSCASWGGMPSTVPSISGADSSPTGSSGVADVLGKPVVMGVQIHPLWKTLFEPLLYLLTAITMGYAVVLFESCVASSAYRRKIELHLLTPLSKIMLGFLVAYLVVRFGDLLVRGALGVAFALSLEAFMFWLETACFVAPLFLIGREADRRNPAKLFLAGIALMAAGALLRINGFLVGYETGDGFQYFPSFPELMVTVGMFAIEVLGYIIITRRFPVLPREA